jgi:hypothetical protein
LVHATLEARGTGTTSLQDGHRHLARGLPGRDCNLLFVRRLAGLAPHASIHGSDGDADNVRDHAPYDPLVLLLALPRSRVASTQRQEDRVTRGWRRGAPDKATLPERLAQDPRADRQPLRVGAPSRDGEVRTQSRKASEVRPRLLLDEPLLQGSFDKRDLVRRTASYVHGNRKPSTATSTMSLVPLPRLIFHSPSPLLIPLYRCGGSNDADEEGIEPPSDDRTGLHRHLHHLCGRGIG